MKMRRQLYCYDDFSPCGYLHVSTGVATENQLSRSVDRAIKHLGLPCDYKINMVMITDQVSKKELYSGYAYIWLSNKKVVYALTNRNLDGSERGQSKKPILALSGYKYTDQQIAHLNKIKFNEDEPIPEYGYFEIERAKVKDNYERKITSILISSNLPEWITEDLLKKEFGRYVSTETLVKNPETGKMEFYPLIKISGPRGLVSGNRLYESISESKRIAQVTFQPDTNDGKFALMMSLRSKFNHPNNPTNNCIVYFRHFDQNMFRYDS